MVERFSVLVECSGAASDSRGCDLRLWRQTDSALVRCLRRKAAGPMLTGFQMGPRHPAKDGWPRANPPAGGLIMSCALYSATPHMEGSLTRNGTLDVKLHEGGAGAGSAV